MSSNVFVPAQFANQYAPSASFNRSYHPITETSIPNRAYHPAPDHYNSDGSNVILNYQPICLNIENATFNNQTFLSDDDTLYAPQSLNAPSLYAPQSLNAPSVYAPQSLNAPQQVYAPQPQIAYAQPQIAYAQPQITYAQPQITYAQHPTYLQPSIVAPQTTYTHQQPLNQNNLSYNWPTQPLDLNFFGNMNVNNNWNTQPSGFNPIGNLNRSYLPPSGSPSLQPIYNTQLQQPNSGIQQNFGLPLQSAIIPGSLKPWGSSPFNF